MTIRHAIVLNNNIEAGTIDTNTVPISSGLNCNAVIAYVKSAVLNNHIAGSFRVTAVVIMQMAVYIHALYQNGVTKYRIDLPHRRIQNGDILNQHVLAIVRLHKIRTQEAIVRAAPILARGFAVLTFCNRRINLALSKQLGAGIVLRFNLFSLALRQIIRARAFPLMPYHRARIFSVAGRRLAIQRTLAGERDVLLAVCVNKRRIVHQFY